MSYVRIIETMEIKINQQTTVALIVVINYLLTWYLQFFNELHEENYASWEILIEDQENLSILIVNIGNQKNKWKFFSGFWPEQGKLGWLLW